MGALVRSNQRAVQQATAEIVEQAEQYLLFVLGGEQFAIAIAGIKEIIEYHPPTTVPMMPAFIRGVINLRGRVVPVVDLSARFGRQSTDNTKRTCFVIIEINHNGERQDIGIVVDLVKAVQEIATKDIEPPPSFGAKIRSDFIAGMGKVGEQFVIILDVDHVLSIDELSMLGEIGEGAVRSPLSEATEPGLTDNSNAAR